MKIKKHLFLTALLLALTSISFAQSKSKAAAAATADAVVKSLYAAQKTNKNPFFQTKSRALIDKFFVKDLADMIWKDSVEAKGELGAIDFDPFFYAQDSDIKQFSVQKPREAGGPDNAFVKVTFKNFGKADWIDYELRREANKTWKIAGVYYRDGEDLASILRYWQDEEFKKEYDNNQTFKGDYMVGKIKCTVIPTLSGMSHRVQCDGQEDFKLYQVEGDETETAYINTNEKGAETGKFVFKNGAASGTFIDASGKRVAVTPIKE